MRDTAGRAVWCQLHRGDHGVAASVRVPPPGGAARPRCTASRPRSAPPPSAPPYDGRPIEIHRRV